MSEQSWRPPNGSECFIELAVREGDPSLTTRASVVAGDGIRLETPEAAPEALLGSEVVVTCGTPEALHVMNGKLIALDESHRFVQLVPIDVMHLQRRNEPRLDIEVPVAMAVAEGPGPNVAIVGRTTNLSSGGCRVVCHDRFPSAEDPTVTLRLDTDGEPVIAAAAIVEAEELSEGWCYRLVFTDIRVDDRMRISRLARG